MSVLDERDREIVSMLERGATQGEIAEAVGISQPSVNARIRRLRESGVLDEVSGVNPFKLGLQLARVSMSARSTREVVGSMEGCPFYAGATITTGGQNLTVYLVGEDASTLESVAEFKFRDNSDVEEVSFDLVLHSTIETVFRLDLDTARDPECGGPGEARCLDMEKRYVGCPLEAGYSGTLWEK